MKLSPKKLNTKYVCHRHFSTTDYLNISIHRLKRTAIPKHYDQLPDQGVISDSVKEHLQVTTPVKKYEASLSIPQYSPKPSTSKEKDSPYSEKLTPKSQKWIADIIDMPELSSTKRRLLMSDEDTPKKKKLKATIKRQQTLIKNKRSTIAKFRKKVLIQQELLSLKNINNIKYTSKASRVLTQMQTLHRLKQPWTREERQFALLSYYKSPKAYKFWRSLGIILPSESTIRKWIGNSKFKAGFSPRLFYQIKKKSEVMTDEEKYCTVIFDEMKIQKGLEYSKYLDQIEGFEDLGNFGRSNKFGTQAMVFLARGIYSSWKMPLAYFICGSSMKHNVLQNLIKSTITKVMDAGLKVVAIVCDQGTNNQSALKSLGISVDKPYFFVDEKKIFSIFDIPHIFKNIRNNFLYNDLVFNGNKVSFTDIRKTYEIDVKSTTGRSLMKLTPEHLNPGPFRKMSCKLALQIFSNSVSAAIKTVINTGQLITETAEYTAIFLKYMNNLFDTTNSKFLYSKNPFQCALSDKRPVVEETIRDAINTMQHLWKLTEKEPTRPPSFDGIVWSLRAILGLYQQQKTLDFPYLLTNRLNQDAIENTFAQFRQRGGYNVNPTARTFRTTFRLSSIANLVKPSEVSNCEIDVDDILTDTESMSANPISEPISTSQSPLSSHSYSCSTSSSGASDNKDEEETEKGTLEDCSNVYFAGYLAKKCHDKFKCDSCKNSLLGVGELENERQLLILNKMYSAQMSVGLTTPSENFVKFVDLSFQTIAAVFKGNPSKRGLYKYISNKIKNQNYFGLIECKDKNHLLYLCQQLIYCKINKECKWRTMNEKNVSRKSFTSKKLNILKSL